jgi:hypothetical protein
MIDRILPLGEMIEASLALVGIPIIMGNLALEVAVPNQVIRLLFARAKEDNPDVEQVSLRLRARNPLWSIGILKGHP